MIKRLFITMLVAVAAIAAYAQYDFIRPVKDSIPGGYNCQCFHFLCCKSTNYK